jgi:hypothetical protein
LFPPRPRFELTRWSEPCRVDDSRVRATSGARRCSSSSAVRCRCCCYTTMSAWSWSRKACPERSSSGSSPSFSVLDLVGYPGATRGNVRHMPSPLEPGEAQRARAVVQPPFRFRRTATANARTRGWLHAACLVVIAVGVATSSAHAAPARIGIDQVRTTAAGVAVTWHAAVSGRYSFWIGGSYCGNGIEGAQGRYRAPRTRTVVLRARRAPRPGSDIRVCLRTSAGTISDAVRRPPAAGADGSLEVPANNRSAFYSALAVATAAFAIAWIGPLLWKRRRARR